MRHVLMVAGVLGLSAACRPQIPPEEVRPAGANVAASPAVGALGVFVAAPDMQATDSECTSYGSATVAEMMRTALQAELTSAGMVVVADETTPHRLTATIRVDLQYCSYRLRAVEGPVSVTLLGDGRMLGQSSYLERRKAPENFGVVSAGHIVPDLLRSPALGQLAAARGASPVLGPLPGAASKGCSKDTDCKGDRVCESGACVTPH